MKIIILNVILACVLVIINVLLGKLQYLYKNIFEYEIFSFAPDSDGNYSGNFFQLIINPVVFVTIICTFAQSNGNTDICINLWQVILYYWGLRIICYLIKGRMLFINFLYEIVAFCISNILGLFVLFKCLIPLIESEQNIFISLETLRDAIWAAIIFYIFKVLWDICKCALKADQVFSQERKEKIVKLRYQKFYQIYDSYIMDVLKKLPSQVRKSEDFKNLIYSIMIYEDYNRPLFYRKIEHIIKKILPKKHMTIGIMQFMTNENITDLESIELACKKLANDYLENLDDEPIGKAIFNYNPSVSYQGEVTAIFDILCN